MRTPVESLFPLQQRVGFEPRHRVVRHDGSLVKSGPELAVQLKQRLPWSEPLGYPGVTCRILNRTLHALCHTDAECHFVVWSSMLAVGSILERSMAALDDAEVVTQ
ncbi:hypothetical protein TNCV_2076681 [Trichonephila clavipes]|nr:hypothetical protein TNCV_2076681 [Trichonephila clavipes]